MIKPELSELPPEKVKKILAWLDREECAWVENCVAAQIAVKQVSATNLALSKPNRTIGDEHALPPEAIDEIKQAAILQTFLDVLRTMRKPETRFQTLKLVIT